ncbi:hypothetical protein [Pseudomonas sp.]|uniref:hypothetical protein n=1 Tax=Pseudomonas sp. TaxID=306 RepID=UPI003FD790FD
MKYQVVYAYESLANFPNTEHPELFDTVQEAFKWVKDNRVKGNVYIIEELEDKMTFSIEKVLRVYDDDEGVYLEIRQNPDFPDSGIEIHTDGSKANEDWFGKISLPINSKAQAQVLAKAILEMSELIK